MRVALFLLMIACVSRTDCLKSSTKRCGRQSFFNDTSTSCQSCQFCGPGTYVRSRCKSSTDTTCRRCPSDHYSTTYSRYPAKCRRCSDCGLREVVSPCTTESDAICGECPLGTYWDYLRSDCVVCSYCYPEYKDSLAIESSCRKAQIPASHHCTKTSWSPYKAPHLIPQTDDEGHTYFISSDDLEKSEEFTSRQSTTVAAESTSAYNHNIASSKSRENRVLVLGEPHEQRLISVEVAVNRLENLYNRHCTRTFIFAGVFCMFILSMAIICVYVKRRPRNSPAPNDRKGLLENDA